MSFTLNATQFAAVQKVHPELVYPFVPNTDNAADSVFFSNSGVAGLKPDASFFSPDFRNPRSLNYTVGVERELSKSMSVALDFVHSNTVHLERIRDTNWFPPVIGNDTGSPPQQRPIFNTASRPNPNFGKLLSQESSARSNYNGLTLSINRRLSRRLQFQINGTVAWNHDNDSNERNFAGITYQDAFNLQQEYSWSRDDIRRRLVASAVYDLPLGFQISGIMTWRTGLPFSAFTNSDSNKDGNFTDRPIINGVLLARNSFRQPNFWNTDMRITKSFRIAERHKVEIERRPVQRVQSRESLLPGVHQRVDDHRQGIDLGNGSDAAFNVCHLSSAGRKPEHRGSERQFADSDPVFRAVHILVRRGQRPRSARKCSRVSKNQICMPQRRTVRFSMVLKIRFSTARPNRITVSNPAKTSAIKS